MKTLIITFAILMIGGFVMGTYLHESVHKEIFRGYGINSTIHIFAFPSAYTIGDKPCPTESCELAHNQNEIITYNLAPFYIIISAGLFFIMIMLYYLVKLKEVEIELKYEK